MGKFLDRQVSSPRPGERSSIGRSFHSSPSEFEGIQGGEVGPPDRIEGKRCSSLRLTSEAGRGVFIREREPNRPAEIRGRDPTDGRVAVRRSVGRRAGNPRSAHISRPAGRARLSRTGVFAPAQAGVTGKAGPTLTRSFAVDLKENEGLYAAE